ncbi:ATP-binding cassette sub-family C member 10 [Hyalella azteca]|uniref:ABC-type xenobiotic transporter n=1 Tax=Hyalella azteca TaxID=294128 RepID=A0A8B7NID9_HYAAZ|nr:ATP-binding cassette sub-family C member 10 [Hyalella azteca]
MSVEGSFFNYTALCGTPSLEIWNPHTRSLGLCFQKLCLNTPVFALLAVVSAYFIGKQSPYVMRNRQDTVVIYCRMILSCAMVLLSVLLEPLTLIFVADAKIFWVDVVSYGVQGLAWTVHLCYLMALKTRHFGSTMRGSVCVLMVWSLSVITAALFTHTCFSKASHAWAPDMRQVMQAIAVCRLTLQMLYCLCLFPEGGETLRSDGSQYREISAEHLLQQQQQQGADSGYTRFHEVATPYHLGAAEVNISWLSYLSLHWVGALMEKGSVGLLNSVDDLHTLPHDLRTQQVSYAVRRYALLTRPLPDDEREPYAFNHHDFPSQSTVISMVRAGHGEQRHLPCTFDSDTTAANAMESPSSSSAMAEDVGPAIENESSPDASTSETLSPTPLPVRSHPKITPAKKFSLLRCLHALFGREFYCIGLLKLLSDSCGFAGPLLLHELVSYVDSKNETLWIGVTYSLCLCLAALIGSLSNVHFNYSMARLNIKVRAAVVTSVYRKIQLLSLAQSSRFKQGEILTLMSTDTERLLNIGPSLHACWSLPLQLLVTLYLLYVQIGWAFLAGVAIVILLLPLNKLLADKIGELSVRMMSYKDRRVTVVAEALTMIRAIHMNCWQRLFADTIDREREGELKALAGRKYLDAACVYFWAATPVLIPIATFCTYISLGNEMDAARVFTAVALFNMLIMPLNAFPWAINGLVEGFVSNKRIANLLEEVEQDLSQYYTIVADMSTASSHLQILLRNASFSWKSGPTASTSAAQTPDDDDDVGDGYNIASRSHDFKKQIARKKHGSSTRKFFGKASQGSDEEELVDGRDDESLADEQDDDDGLNIVPRIGYAASDARPVKSTSSRNAAAILSIKPTLKDVNLEIAKGEVVAIIGKTGSGKTTLINAILAELNKTQGVVAVASLHHGFGYASQDPWIQDQSIRDNILFGSAYNKVRYDAVVQACALHEDITQLTRGDATKCGENGQCLSGGQRTRVALARALYQQKSVYLLDGVLSSVDGPVARHIMREAIMGFLKGKTVLLTTHHVHLTTRCSTIIRLDRGRITHVGSPDDVLPQFLSPQELLRDWWQEDPGTLAWQRTGAVPRRGAATAATTVDEGSATDGAAGAARRAAGLRVATNDGSQPLVLLEKHEKYALISQSTEEDLDPNPSFTHTVVPSSDREHRETGSLAWSVYAAYFSSMGYWLAFLTFLALLGMQFSRNITDLWLAYWVTNAPGGTNLTVVRMASYPNSGGNYWEGSGATGYNTQDWERNTPGETGSDVANFGSWLIHPNVHHHSHVHPFSWEASMSAFIRVPRVDNSGTASLGLLDLHISPTNQYFLTVYCCIAAGHSIFTIIRAFGFAYCGLKAARNLHRKLLTSVLQNPMAFFESNPLGRIINRFSSDLYTVDDALPFQLNILCAQLAGLAGSIILTVYGLPWMILVYIPVALWYYNIQHYYRFSSRDLRRLQALSLSPVYAHFTQTLAGLPTIRAMRAVNSAGSECERLLECSQRCQLSVQAASQWLSLRLQLLAVAVLAGVTGLALLQHHTGAVSPGIVGLVVSYALTINGFLNSVVSSFTDTERELVAVERMEEYIRGDRDFELSLSIGAYGGVHVDPTRRSPAMPALNPGPEWPTHNTIRFEGVSVRYRLYQAHALRDLSFRVGANEKIGILGRTGAGKSSIFAALFRLVELSSGAIYIDNVDIAGLSLERLRTTMAIVTQIPALFTGSVRQNVDPFNRHTDTAIWNALKACYVQTALKDAVARARQLKKLEAQNNPENSGNDDASDVEKLGISENSAASGSRSSDEGGRARRAEEEAKEAVASVLHFPMGDLGRCLSHGERQLLVLARALLTRAKIICVDEGTASLDPLTEDAVQRVLSDTFRNTTVLIVAHRLRTLSDCDRLLVLENGELVEEGSPHELMVRQNSRYCNLMKRQ